MLMNSASFNDCYMGIFIPQGLALLTSLLLLIATIRLGQKNVLFSNIALKRWHAYLV